MVSVSALMKKLTPVKKAAKERIPTTKRSGIRPKIKRAKFEKYHKINLTWILDIR